MESHRALDGKATGIMFVLCIIWGLQQVAIKAAAPDMSPVLQIGLRSGFAAILVGLLIFFRKEGFSLRDGSLRPGLAAGFLFAFEYFLVGEGLRFTTASHMVVFLYTAPIFAALGLHWLLPEERLKSIQWFGIFLAFIGIAVAFFEPEILLHNAAASDILLGDFLALLAGIAWGATTVTIRSTSLSRCSATKTLQYQLTAAFVLLPLCAFFIGQGEFRLTPIVWSSLLYQSVIIGFASFLVWFWLLRNYLASRLGVLTFMTPIFGIIFGVVFLNEPLEFRFLLGTLFVTAGIMIVTGYEWLRNSLKPSPTLKNQ